MQVTWFFPLEQFLDDEEIGKMETKTATLLGGHPCAGCELSAGVNGAWNYRGVNHTDMAYLPCRVAGR